MNTHMNNDRNAPISQKEILLYRTLLALALIVLAAALRIAPHPWNFTPVGAMALFSGAVAIGLWLRDRRTVARISLATLLGAIQFFLVTNFGVWWLLGSFPKSAAGLAACYFAGVPFFWNTLAGDALYATLLFGGYALAERFFPPLREPVRAAR